DNAEPMTQGEYGDDAVACLVSVFQSRIDVLAESRMRGDWRVYPVARYAVMPDPDATPESYTKVAQKQFVLPRIDHSGASAEAFNALMESLADAIETAPAMEEEGASRLDDPASDQQVTATIESVTPQRISVVINDWWFGHGAAHGNYAITYLHYLPDEGRALEASDLFEGDAWQEPLAAAAFAELERSIEGGPWQHSADELVALVSDPARWAFDERGLVLQFQPYEVTAYASGAPKVTVPWPALEAYLAPGSQSLIEVY
ncbi:MAG TPA: DUF3298 domain-containing protein, partial [Alphaproteobacteria bacterium]|nr:DUF3298 domain-containing protein [Alphaproteobacteria bacterium]